MHTAQFQSYIFSHGFEVWTPNSKTIKVQTFLKQIQDILLAVRGYTGRNFCFFQGMGAEFSVSANKNFPCHSKAEEFSIWLSNSEKHWIFWTWAYSSVKSQQLLTKIYDDVTWWAFSPCKAVLSKKLDFWLTTQKDFPSTTSLLLMIYSSHSQKNNNVSIFITVTMKSCLLPWFFSLQILGIFLFKKCGGKQQFYQVFTSKMPEQFDWTLY